MSTKKGLFKMQHDIPNNKLCDSGCGNLAKYFSTGTGRFRCLPSANSCPANRTKNSHGLKQAHKDGKIPSFTDEHRQRSIENHRKNLVQNLSFEKLGYHLRKQIVLEDQGAACLRCGLDTWLDNPIILELDHIDGNRNNNVRNNLRCLCPNCHSQTPTWKTGQTGKRKCTDDEIINAYDETKTISGTLKKLGMNWGSHNTIKRVIKRYNRVDTKN